MVAKTKPYCMYVISCMPQKLLLLCFLSPLSPLITYQWLGKNANEISAGKALPFHCPFWKISTCLWLEKIRKWSISRGWENLKTFRTKLFWQTSSKLLCAQRKIPVETELPIWQKEAKKNKCGLHYMLASGLWWFSIASDYLWMGMDAAVSIYTNKKFGPHHIPKLQYSVLAELTD